MCRGLLFKSFILSTYHFCSRPEIRKRSLKSFSFLVCMERYWRCSGGYSWLCTPESLLMVLGGPCGVRGNELGSAACKARALPTVLWLWIWGWEAVIYSYCSEHCGGWRDSEDGEDLRGRNGGWCVHSHSQFAEVIRDLFSLLKYSSKKAWIFVNMISCVEYLCNQSWIINYSCNI